MFGHKRREENRERMKLINYVLHYTKF